ncbi:MAG: thioredoxin [Solirubrobacterales bacterium]
MAKDVGQATFQSDVIDRSSEVPVVVDFWAEWCGPCRQLGPALESAVDGRKGDVELVKIDVDENQSLAAEYGIQGIPAVKAFKDGKVAEEFTGAIPPTQIDAFLNAIVPSEADRLAENGDEAALRKALEVDPGHADAAAQLGRILLARGDNTEAAKILGGHPGDFIADGLGARAQLMADANGDAADGLAAAFSAWDAGEHEAALEGIHDAIAATEDPDRRDLLRRTMVGMLTELGAGNPLAREHRRRLAASLS